MEKVSSEFAVVMNMRSVVSMEMSFGQDFEPLHPVEGWKVTARKEGELLVRLGGGATQSIPFAVGDHLRVVGDYIYVGLGQRPTPPKGNGSGRGKTRSSDPGGPR